MNQRNIRILRVDYLYLLGKKPTEITFYTVVSNEQKDG